MTPVPRHVERLGGEVPAVVLHEELDPRLPHQGYELLAQDDGVRIRHRDALGLRYARQTLADRTRAGILEAVRIVDHPDLPHRGFMLDISRDRVPTNETLGWLVGVLDALRYDQLQLYVEHTFAHRGHESVWSGASPLTAEDLRWLDDRCAAHGITLVANRNTFGHMERWLRHDEHRWRAECPDGATSPVTGRRTPPSTLAPTEENADFALGLVRELAAQVRGTTVHIGADEPFELGQCASAADVGARGRAAVYLDHVQRLLQPLVADGFQVQLWADVLRRHPELVRRLPRHGVTPVVWHYEAPSEDTWLAEAMGPELLEQLGLPDDFHTGFVAHVRSFVSAEHPFWVAPGTSTWNALLGRWANARANLLDAASTGLATGAGGYLLTDWGDNGHLQPITVSLLPLVYGAGVAWCAETNAAVDPAPVVDELTAIAGLGSQLAALGDVHELTGVHSINGSPLFAALDPARPLPLLGHTDAEHLDDTQQALDAALTWLDGLPPSVHRDSLVAATRLARHGAWRLARRDRLPVPGDAALAADIAECRDLQRAAWVATSRPGGLDDSLRHLPTY